MELGFVRHWKGKEWERGRGLEEAGLRVGKIEGLMEETALKKV